MAQMFVEDPWTLFVTQLKRRNLSFDNVKHCSDRTSLLASLMPSADPITLGMLETSWEEQEQGITHRHDNSSQQQQEQPQPHPESESMTLLKEFCDALIGLGGEKFIVLVLQHPDPISRQEQEQEPERRATTERLVVSEQCPRELVGQAMHIVKIASLVRIVQTGIEEGLEAAAATSLTFDAFKWAMTDELCSILQQLGEIKSSVLARWAPVLNGSRAAAAAARGCGEESVTEVCQSVQALAQLVADNAIFESLQLLEAIAVTLTTSAATTLTPMQLLSQLYDDFNAFTSSSSLSSSSDAEAAKCAILKRILKKSTKPLSHMIALWVHSGVLDDPFREFIVTLVEDENKSATTGGKDQRNYWANISARSVGANSSSLFLSSSSPTTTTTSSMLREYGTPYVMNLKRCPNFLRASPSVMQSLLSCGAYIAMTNQHIDAANRNRSRQTLAFSVETLRDNTDHQNSSNNSSAMQQQQYGGGALLELHKSLVRDELTAFREGVEEALRRTSSAVLASLLRTVLPSGSGIDTSPRTRFIEIPALELLRLLVTASLDLEASWGAALDAVIHTLNSEVADVTDAADRTFARMHLVYSRAIASERMKVAWSRYFRVERSSGSSRGDASSTSMSMMANDEFVDVDEEKDGGVQRHQAPLPQLYHAICVSFVPEDSMCFPCSRSALDLLRHASQVCFRVRAVAVILAQWWTDLFKAVRSYAGNPQQSSLFGKLSAVVGAVRTSIKRIETFLYTHCEPMARHAASPLFCSSSLEQQHQPGIATSMTIEDVKRLVDAFASELNASFLRVTPPSAHAGYGHATASPLWSILDSVDEFLTKLKGIVSLSTDDTTEEHVRETILGLRLREVTGLATQIDEELCAYIFPSQEQQQQQQQQQQGTSRRFLYE